MLCIKIQQMWRNRLQDSALTHLSDLLGLETASQIRSWRCFSYASRSICMHNEIPADFIILIILLYTLVRRIRISTNSFASCTRNHSLQLRGWALTSQGIYLPNEDRGCTYSAYKLPYKNLSHTYFFLLSITPNPTQSRK